jgi:hypothetical protein
MVIRKLIKKISNRAKRLLAWMRRVKIHWAPSRDKKVDVVIFDASNREKDDLLPLCGDAQVVLLDVSGLTLQLNWDVICQLVFLVLRGTSIHASYYAVVLRRLSPAIVITYIDNSDLFYKVARANYHRMRFLAIQNGARYDVVEMSAQEGRRIFIPEFACFGEYEKDLYQSKGARVGRYIPVGSLREANFRRYWQDAGPVSSERYDYDLCVVAEASPGWDKKYPGSEDAFGNIAKYAVRFARENGLKVVIAGKRDIAPLRALAGTHSRDTEVGWYSKYIGTEVPITPRVRDQFTTYGLMSRSRVSLALMSTTLREAANRGNRVVFCNFSGDPRWDFCVEGIWSLTEGSYEAFAVRIMAVLSMSDEDYRREATKMVPYVMNNEDQNPTYVILQKIIADAVSARASIPPIPAV